ncbi:hypothetical protein [Natrinema gari]|uniref:Uncharacterized protein n=1 Tax=Natrinema gari JCM 14663 TaxID=1230459 RepID=L9Z5V7_9EURY|nr:hypothetical protein [Natrinema gari]ELY81037.1 hypothetical protein C486_08063 [Natrinema gari JCM 14663]
MTFWTRSKTKSRTNRLSFVADFIESTDLDHEYHQVTHVDALVAEHGWTAEIEYLLTIHARDAIGQHGLEQLEKHADLVRDNLSIPRHKSTMFDAFLTHCLLLRN